MYIGAHELTAGLFIANSVMYLALASISVLVGISCYMKYCKLSVGCHFLGFAAQACGTLWCDHV
jgi:hypothetical protein